MQITQDDIFLIESAVVVVIYLAVVGTVKWLNWREDEKEWKRFLREIRKFS